jgi:ribonuclease III
VAHGAPQESPGTGATPLERALGYTFTDRGLLRRALTHRSSDPDLSNERLEFLGDAVLEFVITSHLYATSGGNEGEMTKVRLSVVSQSAQAPLAEVLGVGGAVRLDAGEEETGGRRKPSILANTLEALLGAVYLDGGLAAAERVIMAHWAPLIAARVGAPGGEDYKTRLQEVLAQAGLVPAYASQGEGPDHARVYFATVSAGGRLLGSGTGTSKKAAEQAAAQTALDLLAGEEPADA